MESSQDYNSLRETIQPALVTVTRSAGVVANEDLQFQRTVRPSVGDKLDKTADRMLGLVNGLLKSSSKVTGQSTTKLEDIDDIEIKWRGIVDVIDSFLEKADTCLDEYTGLIKRKNAPTVEEVCFFFVLYMFYRVTLTSSFTGPRPQAIEIDGAARLVSQARQHCQAPEWVREEAQ